MKVAPLSLLAATAAANVMQIGLQQMAPGPAALARRAAGPAAEALAFNYTGGGYFARVAVGTPPQEQVLLVSSATSDTYVVGYDADLCTNEEAQMLEKDGCGETFNRNASSTYRLVQEDGLEVWYDPFPAFGDFFNDTFAIGGATATDLTIGYGTQVLQGFGVLALGYATAEVGDDPHPTVLDQLQAQGQIGSRAYSLYLDGVGSGGGGGDDDDDGAGALLLGGIDTDKFTGRLVPLPTRRTFPLNNETATQSSPYAAPAVDLASFTVLVDGVGGRNATTLAPPGGVAGPVAAVLDTSRLLTEVPQDMAAALFDAVGAFVSEGLYAYIDCASTAALRLEFGTGADASVTITVPAAYLALDVLDQSQIPDGFPAFSRTCVFGIQNLDVVHLRGSSPSKRGHGDHRRRSTPNSSFVRLGTSVLRALYTVVDQDHNQIALAQARPNSTASTLVVLDAAATGLPATLTGGASPPATATATGTATGTATDSAATTPTATGTATATPTSASSAAGTVRGSCGGVLAMLALLCLL